MKINYKFRNSSIDAFQTQYADEKFANLAKIAPKNSTLEIEFNDALGKKGNGFEVRLNLDYPGQKDPVYISVSSSSFQTSIDQVKEKLDSIFRKLKEKYR